MQGTRITLFHHRSASITCLESFSQILELVWREGKKSHRNQLLKTVMLSIIQAEAQNISLCHNEAKLLQTLKLLV